MPESDKMKTVVAGALGECVHVAGVLNFLRLAQEAGWRTVFLGPAVPVPEFLAAVRREQADLVGVSYRLTPETGERLLTDFAEAADDLYAAGVRFAFGGTPPVAARAQALGFFERCFDGRDQPEAVLAYLKGQAPAIQAEAGYPQTAVERIIWKAPFPLLRHHFGLPTMAATVDGIAHIAEAGVLDVISLGIDQDAQANFFHPERQDRRRTGAGGVPVRSADDYRALYAASRRGNYPLLRTYAGTDDFIRLAAVYVEMINIAWYGERNIPVELNEPHHWGMRDAPDTLFVVSAYLSAYNARAFGVRDYIAQFMFNSPPGLTDKMDLAKMLAALELIEPLAGRDFRIWRQTRTGLLSYPLDIDAARAHLAATVYLQMALRPHIVHVVGHTEAHHAATAADVVEACNLARQVITHTLRGQPDMTVDPAVQARRAELVDEARQTVAAIQQLGNSGAADPLTDPTILARAVTTGLLDAPHLRNNPFARGRIATTGAYPQFIASPDVLHTSLNNMGAIFHPALTLLNAGRIESTAGQFQFYIDGVTPSVGRVLEVLDRERVTVASALGIRGQTGLEWLRMAYNAKGVDLHEAIHNQPGYKGIMAPATLNHRYITEDIPMSLVPIAALGRRYGVSVNGIDSIIRLACIIHRTDYWRRGRTLEKLGIQDLSVSELTRYVAEGFRE